MNDAEPSPAAFASPETLLGRLQRGRGDAVREVLDMGRAAGGSMLIAVLCTREGDGCELLEHREGFAELVMTLQPDLAPWFAWIDGLPADLEEDLRLFPFHLLGDLARREYDGCEAELRRHLRQGPHWQLALDQYLPESGLHLDFAAWREVLPRLDEETLSRHVDPDEPMWSALAAAEPRVAACLQAKIACRARRAAREQWSPTNYAGASRSALRWRIVQDLLRRDAAAARPLLIDGLWDTSRLYRERCIAECDLAWPGVRERMEQLAADPHAAASEAARRRLGGH